MNRTIQDSIRRALCANPLPDATRSGAMSRGCRHTRGRVPRWKAGLPVESFSLPHGHRIGQRAALVDHTDTQHYEGLEKPACTGRAQAPD
jgi:hypothetical protein